MEKRRWDTILHELRKLVFGASCAIGGLAGLWWAMWGTAELEPRGSLGADLLGTLQPVLGRFGIGLAIGVAFGLLVCSTALKPRR
jgi:hypothetical protein